MASNAQAGTEQLRKPPLGGFGPFGAVARSIYRFCKRKPLGGVGLFILFAVAFVALFGNLIKPMDPLEIHARSLFHGPEWFKGFILGTDHLGRDNLSRLMVGARASLSVAIIAVFSGSLVGFMMGLYSGFFPDWRDTVISRLVDMKMAIPTIVLALAIVAVLGQSTRNVIIAISIIQVPSTARVVRSVVIAIRDIEYVQAARAIGATNTRILMRHIAPQTFAPVMILVTAHLGLAIIIESSLSFLGLGTPPPNPAWGAMLSGPTLQNVEKAPWNAVFPGLALTLTVFSFNLVGDSLRDYLDPRLRA